MLLTGPAVQLDADGALVRKSKSRLKTRAHDESARGPIPGYDQIDPQSFAPVLEDNPETALAETTSLLLQALRSRDAVAVLAKTGEQLLREIGKEIGTGASGLEQVNAEVLQAFALTAGLGTSVPSSPHSMVRIWSLVQRNLNSYVQLTAPGPEADGDVKLARRVRMRTVFYRNVFNSDDAAEIVPELFTIMDAASERELGYRLSDLARAMFALLKVVAERFNVRINREHTLKHRPGAPADGVIETMLQEFAEARRMWRVTPGCSLSPESRGWAGFQMAEMLCARLFTFTRAELETSFGAPVSDALFTRSMSFGSIRQEDLGKVYLANPIWERPFVTLNADTLLLPLPFLFVSFPFAIVEGLIAGIAKLEKAYGTARARYLENDIERVVRRSLPSARVHRGLKWNDPDTGTQYEHDIVAILGMQVLIFEAKSGKLSPSARRGGVLRLQIVSHRVV